MNSTVSGSPRSYRLCRAIRLWLSLHRLGDILDDLSSQAPSTIPIDLPESPNNPWPTPIMPASQAAFQEWLVSASKSIYHLENLPDLPIFTLEAPAVRGLSTYAAMCGPFRFYAAWVEWSGTFIREEATANRGWQRSVSDRMETTGFPGLARRTNRGTNALSAGSVEFSRWSFIGWMRTQPVVVGVDSEYAVGEVLGRPLFMGVVIDLSGHDASDRFSAALKNAAWDLGVAGG